MFLGGNSGLDHRHTLAMKGACTSKRNSGKAIRRSAGENTNTAALETLRPKAATGLIVKDGLHSLHATKGLPCKPT